MKKSLMNLAIVAAVSTVSAGVAQACTTWVADTDHGVSVTRSVDWYTKLGAIAHVTPRGSALQADVRKGYANAASWTSVYQTVAIEEYESFHGASVTAINVDKGLSVNGQYMEDSKPYLAQHRDSGAPAVSLGQLATYIAGNFGTVAEVKEALDNNRFQVAWSAGLAGADHGVHFSVQDRGNNKLLIQLNEGGIQLLHHNEDDLRSMTNAPLQQYHREYVADLDMKRADTLAQMSAHISPSERNARLLFMSEQVKLTDQALSWPQTEGKILGTFDAAVLVPQDLVDPDNGDTYATWVSYVYNFDTGSFKLRNHETYNSIRIDLHGVQGFDTPMCANLIEQADAGQVQAQWDACEVVLPTQG